MYGTRVLVTHNRGSDHTVDVRVTKGRCPWGRSLQKAAKTSLYILSIEGQGRM
jgi:hypothetical protein